MEEGTGVNAETERGGGGWFRSVLWYALRDVKCLVFADLLIEKNINNHDAPKQSTRLCVFIRTVSISGAYARLVNGETIR